MGGPHGMRSFMRDRSVVDLLVAPGTGKRMLGFAVPDRRLIGWFLGMVVIDTGRIVERGTHDALLTQGGLNAERHHTQFADQADH